MILLAAALLAFSPQEVPKIQPREIHERRQNYTIDVRYPEIANAKGFNTAVRQSLNAKLAAFRERAVPGAALPNYGAYLKEDYTAATLKTGIISVLLEWDEYTPGAVHPYGGMASFNYDARAHRLLKLSDLFRPRVDYLSRLSQLAIAALDREELGNPDVVRRGAGPVEDNFRVFTLTDDALVLHFPAYQVASGAAGPQRVVIPLEKLTPLLRKR